MDQFPIPRHDSNDNPVRLRLTRRGKLVLGTVAAVASGLAALGLTKGVPQVIEEFRPGIAVACGDGYVQHNYTDGAQSAINALTQNGFSVDDNPGYVGQDLADKKGDVLAGTLVRLHVDEEGNLTNNHPVEIRCFTENQK